tara:strand:+ start:1244 stop:1525 length:282 start_codon:yes stop_codon:yes gene_type:complete
MLGAAHSHNVELLSSQLAHPLGLATAALVGLPLVVFGRSSGGRNGGSLVRCCPQVGRDVPSHGGDGGASGRDGGRQGSGARRRELKASAEEVV